MTLSGKSLEKSNIEEKINLYINALKLDSEDVDAAKALAFCYKDLGRLDLAIKYFSIAKRKTPFDKVLYYELGKLEYAKRNYVKAIKHFMNAVKLSPNYTESIIAMGEVHEEIEEFNMAEMIYLKILEKSPTNQEACLKLGYLYIKTGDYKKALNCFRDVLAQDTQNSEAYYGLAKCFDEAGKEIEARRYYKKYLNMEPHGEKSNIISSRLKEMSIPKRKTSISRSHLRLV
ncbi:MAG: tetratricopeptide repeat protein [bacterium]|nr:tetratricopeptide repeat protein [bacterium]